MTTFSASAQENDREVPSRELQAAQEALEAAKSSQERAAVSSGETVTFQDVLKDPDNLDLNFRFARAQVDRGEYLSASATLERILLIDPTLTSVRFFYAMVLYRLDNLQDAQQQFERVRNEDLPQEARLQIESALREIRLRRKSTRWDATLAAGFGYDSNRNASPASKEQLFNDVPLTVSGTSRQRRDTHFLAVETLSVAHDLGTQAGHQLIGSFSSYLGEQTVADDLDLQSYAFDAGAVLKTPLVQFTPTLFADHILLSRETYLRNLGFRTAWRRPIGRRFTFDVLQSWAHEGYSGITESTVADERTGSLLAVTTEAGFLITPSMKLSGSIGCEKKHAKADYNAYRGFTLGGNHTWILPAGQFLINSLTYTANTYDQPDVAVSVRTRRDQHLRYRATYGAPVTLFLTERLLPDWVTRDLTTSLSFEQFRSFSSIINYTYKNSKLSCMLSKHVEF